MEQLQTMCRSLKRYTKIGKFLRMNQVCKYTLNQPVPLDLMQKIVELRAKKNHSTK